MPRLWHERQKAQGVKLILSWFAPRRCWKKYHNGKVRYFKHPNSAEGYEAAVAEYHAWLQREKQTRPLGAEYEHHIRLLRQCVEWYDRFGIPEVEEEQRVEIGSLVGRIEQTFEAEDPLPPLRSCLPNGCNIAEKQIIMTFCADGIAGNENVTSPLQKQFGTLGWSLSEMWQERIRQLNVLTAHQRKLPQTVEHQVQRFLDFKELQVRGGVLKSRTWGTLAERLPIFVKWIRPGTHVSTINGTTIREFYKWLLQQPWGQERKKDIFNTARQWIRWAWRQDDVELEHLPKSIDSREHVFLAHIDGTGVAKKTRTELLWTPDEFRRALDIVPEDFQLFLLLMLNCGFTNTDVGELLKSEVRLDEGRIVRQRTKTRRHEHPPVVSYKLWPKTLHFLQAHIGSHPTLALTNRAGKPLCVSKLVEKDGKTRETVWSSIIRRWGQMKNAKPQLPNKQLKYLRKTGSSKLRSDRRFMSLDSLYLGHSWVTIADKHYNAFDGQPYAPLDEAIEWLAAEFKIP